MKDTEHLIFDSQGFSLRLTSQEHAQFKVEQEAFENRWMLLEQERRGLWAGNQNKYVQRLSDLNNLDIKPRVIHEKFKGT